MIRLCKFFAALFLLLSFAHRLDAGQMTFSDGSGNKYSAASTLLFYDPVTPAQSSSGLYSGGSPAACVLKPEDHALLERLFAAAIQAKEEHTDARVKGSFQVAKDQASVLLKPGSKRGLELEKALKNLLANNSSRIARDYRVSRDGNPWHGMTDTAAQEEKNLQIRADQPRGTAVSGEAVLFNGAPVLYRLEAEKEVIVDARVFGPLVRADATRLKPGELKRIGQAASQDALRPSFLLPFLLQGQIIITYWHTDSLLRLVREETKSGRICYVFEGEHHYYTNQKNTGSVRFAVCVDNRSKEIFAEGR